MLETTGADLVFLLARSLFGGVLAFMGLNHFMQTDGMAGYAESKGIPAPRLSVLLSGLLLTASGLGIVLGVFPLLAAAGLVLLQVSVGDLVVRTHLSVSTTTIHSTLALILFCLLLWHTLVLHGQSLLEQ